MLAKEFNDHFYNESVLAFAFGTVKYMGDITDDTMNEVICVSQYWAIRVVEIAVWV